MLVEKPKVRMAVEAAVREIEAEGVKPSVSDILWLAHLAEEKIQPNRSDPLDDFDVPVRCGKADLYRLTVSGDIWLRECAGKWWPRPAHSWMAMLAELYALAHGKDGAVMASIWDKATARAAIVAWACANLPVSPAKIKRALYLVSGCVDREEIEDPNLTKQAEGPSPFDWGEEVAMLCAVYKQPPEHFMFRLSIPQVARLMRKAAYAMGRPDLASDKSSADEAFGKFRLAVKEIIRRGQEPAAQNG